MPDNIEKEIVLRTEEVNEILTVPPAWIVRWGITIVFLVLVLGLTLSYFIHYPDKLTAKTTITTLNPPVTLVAKVNGKLTFLLVKNNQVIGKEQVLGVIENTANPIQVLDVEKIIDSLIYQLRTKDYVFVLPLSDTLKLGDVTPQYLTFLKCYKDYKLFAEISPQLQEVRILEKELAEYAILLDKYKKEEDIFQEEYMLTEKDYNRDLGLLKEGVISPRDFELKKKDYLGAQRNFENQKINTSNTKITINGIEKNKLQLQIQEYQERSKYREDLEQAINNLKAAINTWKANYLLQSPIAGKVSFFNYWTVNQNIKTGDAVFSVVPTGQQEIIAKLILPTQNSGKVKVGQKVNIKLDNYPYTEYGMLNGTVNNISLVPNNNTFAIDVELSKGLTTSYNKTLTYKEEMSGSGEIITTNLSVLDRVFMKLKKMIAK